MKRQIGDLVERKGLQRRLAELDAAESLVDLLVGTGRWEQLSGDRAGQWSGRISGNRRIIIEPWGEDENALVVGLIDYH